VTAAALALLLCAAPAAAADNGEVRLRAEAAAIVDLFYAHDFDRADPAADALAARHPGHPAGPLFQAIVAYQRWLAEGLKEDGSWERIDALLSKAVAESGPLAATAPAESHYYRGAALGFRARGLAATHHMLRALPDAASSVRELRQALDLDPSLEDARLGLGMYHYFAARMPGAAKPLAKLLVGEPPDREKGLAELWQVARSTGIARMEARAVLSMILSKDEEADWSGAETLLAELMTRYPRNPIYRLRRTFVAERRGDWDAAAELADPDGPWIAALDPRLRDNTRAWARYRLAEIRLFQGRLDDAAASLALLKGVKAPKKLAPWIGRRRNEVDGARHGRAIPPVVAPYFSGY
jgi:tetratricopeptide (TPR) repeat protein